MYAGASWTYKLSCVWNVINNVMAIENKEKSNRKHGDNVATLSKTREQTLGQEEGKSGSICKQKQAVHQKKN